MKFPDGVYGGPRGKGCGPRGERMERGTLRILLLDALQDGPKHGYEIMKSMENRAKGQYSPSPGTIYPTLQLLEDEQLVRVSADGDRRVYELTENGKADVLAQSDKIAAFWARFDEKPVPEAAKREIGFLNDELEAFARTIWRGLQYEIETGDKEAIKRMRLTVQKCHEEVRAALAEQ